MCGIDQNGVISHAISKLSGEVQISVDLKAGLLYCSFSLSCALLCSRSLD